MTMITQREFEDQVNDLIGNGELTAPAVKDEIIKMMCSILKQFGYEAGVNAFTSIFKTYKE